LQCPPPLVQSAEAVGYLSKCFLFHFGNHFIFDAILMVLPTTTKEPLPSWCDADGHSTLADYSIILILHHYIKSLKTHSLQDNDASGIIQSGIRKRKCLRTD
jgi:hypothetical protein